MKKKIIVGIFACGVIIVTLLCVCIFRSVSGSIAVGELTMEEKLEDFENFYATILESAPYLDELKELYGIDFVGRKEYYIQEIKSTKNNVEFYGVMEAIATDIPSFHTDVWFPLYSYLRTMDCYQSRWTLAQFGLKDKIDEWTEEIGNMVQQYEDVDLMGVWYVDGKYVTKRDDLWYELITVDGVSADEYVVQNISLYEIHYDYQWDKAYREGFIFNDSIGRKVTLTWKDEKENEIEEEWYVDYGANTVAGYGYMFSDDEEPEIPGEPDIVTYRDDVNQLEYIQINNFLNTEGRELLEYLENAEYDRIVIDLRENYGGYANYGERYIFPALYDTDITFSYSWRVPNTKANEPMTKNWIVWLKYPCTKKDGYCYYTETMEYSGNQSEEREIYYLVSSDTGSAADGYIAFIKENNLGTIVGTTTGGEGLGPSYICDSLKNSSLIYTYYPAEYVGMEQTNPCVGVVPDVYLNQTLEDHKLERQYNEQDIAQEYERRLEYDTVLKWVIQQMRSDK